MAVVPEGDMVDQRDQRHSKQARRDTSCTHGHISRYQDQDHADDHGREPHVLVRDDPVILRGNPRHLLHLRRLDPTDALTSIPHSGLPFDHVASSPGRSAAAHDQEPLIVKQHDRISDYDQHTRPPYGAG